MTYAFANDPSPAEIVAELSEDEQDIFFSLLSEEQLERLPWTFFGWLARDKKQNILRSFECEDAACGCEGKWSKLALICGRGFGKTRVAAETVHYLAERYPGCSIALVGPTAGDVRDVLVEGPSGLEGCRKPWLPFHYYPTNNQVNYENGTICYTLSAESPERARGKNTHFLVLDELATWEPVKKAATFIHNLELTRRLKKKPGWPDDFRNRTIITTTPKPNDLILKLLGYPPHPKMNTKEYGGKVHVIYGDTRENSANLSEEFINEIVANLDGTRLGQQELQGIVLLDAAGALWKQSMFQTIPSEHIPELPRIIIAVDPSAGGANETGIVVFGCGPPPSHMESKSEASEDQRIITALQKQGRLHGYVLDDLSKKMSAEQWARTAIRAYWHWDAEAIVCEANNGGDLVRQAIHGIDPRVKVRLVWAVKDKKNRAVPATAPYEQGRVWHVKGLADLERQLTTWEPDGKDPSPDRLDALVWGVRYLLGAGMARGIVGKPIGLPKGSLAESVEDE